MRIIIDGRLKKTPGITVIGGFIYTSTMKMCQATTVRGRIPIMFTCRIIPNICVSATGILGK